MSEFSYRFSLFVNNQRKYENSPNHTGFLEIPANEVPVLIAWLQSVEPEMDYRNNPVVKLRLAAWDSEAESTGLRYLAGQMSPPLPPLDRESSGSTRASGRTRSSGSTAQRAVKAQPVFDAELDDIPF